MIKIFLSLPAVAHRLTNALCAFVDITSYIIDYYHLNGGIGIFLLIYETLNKELLINKIENKTYEVQGKTQNCDNELS